MEGASPLPRAQALTLGGPGCHLSPVDLEGIVGKDGNQDDAKNLWELEQGGHNKGHQAIDTGEREVGDMGQGVRQTPGTGLSLGWREAHKVCNHQPKVLGEPESSVGLTHKSSNGSSVPGGHSRKGDHQEDDAGADTAEEVLGVGGAGSKGSRGQGASP